jgi:hypothetical protein
VDLLPVNEHMGRSFNTEADAISLQFENCDSDGAIDYDRFARPSRENQHVRPSLKTKCGPIDPTGFFGREDFAGDKRLECKVQACSSGRSGVNRSATADLGTVEGKSKTPHVQGPHRGAIVAK